MNLLDSLKNIAARATTLEMEATNLRAEVSALRALIFGPAPDVVDQAPSTPAPEQVQTAAQDKAPANKGPKSNLPTRPSDPAPAMPSADDIRAKAKQYGVDVDDVMPKGKKPTIQQKQDAMKKIADAKRLASTPEPAEDESDEGEATDGEAPAEPPAPSDEDDIDVGALLNS